MDRPRPLIRRRPVGRPSGPPARAALTLRRRYTTSLAGASCLSDALPGAKGRTGRVEFGHALNEKRHDPAAAGATEKRLAGGILPDRDRGIRRAGDRRRAAGGG